MRMHAKTPSLQILEKEKQLQKKLLSKEKRNWLGFIHAGGSASYGIADNVASNTDVNTPLIYRYVGTEQTSWNVGGGISIPFEKLFDLRGRNQAPANPGGYCRVKKTGSIRNP
ncbi:hypothetical protein NXW05_13895 [Phocaeicola vulgatus]|nr:hypothetical protein [Phocaeicola vulgatus]